MSLKISEVLDQYKSIDSLSERAINDYADRIKTLLTKSQDYPYIPDYNSTLYDLLACVYFFALHNSSKALETINKSIELWPYDPNSQALRGVFRTDIQRPIERYIKLQDIIQYKEAEVESPFLSKSEFNTELQAAATKFADDFLQIPKERRKFLVIDDEFRFLPNSFLVLTHDEIATLEDKGLTFPNGFANEKTLYLCHPYKPNEYLDAEDYKDELFYDQVGELIEILQCLGAKMIDITDLQTHETTEKESVDYKAKIGGGVDEFKGSAEGEFLNDITSYEKSKMELFQHYEFPLGNEPHIPSGTVWYEHMSDWQRKARIRLRGEDNFKIRCSSLKETLIKENEMIQLKADFEKLLVKANIEGGRSLSLERKNSSFHDWEMNVDFYPLNEYRPKQIETVTAAPQPALQQQPVPTTFPKKRNWIVWAMGGIILILIVTLLFLLL